MSRTAMVGVGLMIGMAASGAYGQGAAAQPKMKAAPGPIVAAGASFAEPRGWSRLKTTQAKTIGWFVDPASTSADPKRMIMVDFGRPTEPDAKSAAEQLAKNWGGAVLKEPALLDGAPGYRVRVERRGPGMKPVEGIIVHRAGRAYMIMGGTVPGLSVADELEQVRKGWKWVATSK